VLILARRPNESLVIAGNITVTVLGIHGSQVRLGITAPPDITIDRAEVHQRKLAEYRASAKPTVRDPIHPAPA
jgi:carbon storage regulator